jgi:hypothetical protein
MRWKKNNTVRKRVSIASFSALKRRHLHEAQVYSKLYYESKLKAIVDEELKGTWLTPQERLPKTVEVTKREWANESDEVQRQVRERRKELRKEQNSDQALSWAIDHLGHVVGDFLQQLKKATGWTGFFVTGGPKPDMGGELAIAS